VVALPAHLAKVCDLPVDETLAIGLGSVEQAGDARRREQSVVLGLERGELFTSNVGAATRHHHRSIPSQEREGAAEGIKPFELLFELLIR
jgi:hypothetical protein